MKRSELKRRTRIKPVGKRGKRNRSELAAITPALKAVSKGLCMHCGNLPDWRGLQRHHLIHRSALGKNTKDNVELWCAPCHFGPDGHRTEIRRR